MDFEALSREYMRVYREKLRSLPDVVSGSELPAMASEWDVFCDVLKRASSDAAGTMEDDVGVAIFRFFGILFVLSVGSYWRTRHRSLSEFLSTHVPTSAEKYEKDMFRDQLPNRALMR